MDENKLKHLRQVLQMLSTEEEFENLREFFQHFASHRQVPILTFDELGGGKSRVFSLWEQAFIAQEARTFLLTALYTGAITSFELEQTLALLYTQLQGFADLEKVLDILETVVEDLDRNAMFALYAFDYIH
ncbi:MAG: hypothetical protein GX971_00590 [Firmicutes bacterium]|nr:hypothetical protein [Bacillota bacterium]